MRTKRCASQVEAVISVESGGNPFALHVNDMREQPPSPRDAREAAQIADAIYCAAVTASISG